MNTPKPIFGIVADLLGTVEYSSNSLTHCQFFLMRIPSQFRDVYSVWEFKPAKSVTIQEMIDHDNKR